MRVVRKKRVAFISLLLFGCTVVTALVLYALNKNINFYYTPKEIINGKVQIGQRIRLGGVIISGTVKHYERLGVKFVIADSQAEITINYIGILPDLFKEGQGVVVRGQLVTSNSFKASQVLAKHDENYMPPNIALCFQN